MATDKQNKVLNVPPLRFPEFHDEWKRYKLGDISERVTRKNNGASELPLTISAQYGLVDQVTFFNRQIASVDMSNYFLLKRGEFAYNKSYSNDYPWGAVKRLDLYDEGTLSTLYICFALKGDVNSDYITHYFESPKWYKGVYEIAGEGARNHGLLNIAVGDYFATQHYLPQDKLEQEKIANIFNLLERRIAVQSKIIEQLQSLMVGIRKAIFSSQMNSEERRLGDFLSEYVERNGDATRTSVAIGKYGIRKRDEIYSRELSKDYSQNKVIRKNTLTIGMGSSQIDIGILKDDIEYCVSPAYTTFLIHGINAQYLEEYLIYLNPRLSFKYMVTSVRQGKSVNKEELLQHRIAVCSELQQISIQEKFNLFNRWIRNEQNLLNSYKQQKAYLLQQMFI